VEVGNFPQPGLARRPAVNKNLCRKSRKLSTQKTCQEKNKKKSKKKSQKKVDRIEKSLILFRMNLINLLPRTAAEEIAALSPAEIAEMEAFFAFVDSVNDEVDAAWDRLAALVDSGAL